MIHHHYKLAKTILFEIVRQDGGAFFGKTRLNKVFYAAHLFHWTNHTGVLSDYPIVRMPKGPAVDNLDMLLSSLESEGLIHIASRPNGPFREQVYTSITDVETLLSQEQIDSIKMAVAWAAGKRGVELSDIAHDFSRTWDETPNGGQMDIYLDLLSDEEYSEMDSRQRGIKESLHAFAWPTESGQAN